MAKFSDKILLIHAEDIPALAGYVLECMRKEPDLIRDTAYLKVPQLSKAINVGQDRIRAAIKAKHYGYIHPGQGKRDQYYGTATEARAYHFGTEGKKFSPRR